jgi:catechol 2,3-dioxygenase-like lactoylglutathione lyase family enzyme
VAPPSLTPVSDGRSVLVSTSMLDHIGLRVQDFPRALAFYRAALAPIGYKVIMEFPEAAGLGERGKPDFWISKTAEVESAVHLAFVGTRESVAAFHAAALAAGGVDNGPPGPRPDYHPHYFGAFILDPYGNNIEVVCHDPLTPPRAAGRKKPVARKRLPVRAASRAAKPATTAKKKKKGGRR